MALKVAGARFIPAYAGNSCRGRSRPKASTVHPRLRGELVTTIQFTLTQVRFIPAYAGNSRKNSAKLPLTPVHPRLRGELSLDSTISPVNSRFIPAYAGNSLKQGIEHLTNSSKDFLSGKYAKNPETVLNHFKNSSLD